MYAAAGSVISALSSVWSFIMRQEAVLGKPCVTCIEPEKCRKLHCSNMGEVVYYIKAILYHFCNSWGTWEAFVFYNKSFLFNVWREPLYFWRKHPLGLMDEPVLGVKGRGHRWPQLRNVYPSYEYILHQWWDQLHIIFWDNIQHHNSYRRGNFVHI